MYFSSYPNNRLFLWFLVSIESICHKLNLHDFEYLSVVYLQCIINSFTGFLLTKTVQKLFNKNTLTVISLVLYFLLIGISPWVSIPYTDSIGLLFPTLILYIYISKKQFKHTYYMWAIIAVLSTIGINLKPQLVIVTIAIVIIEIISIHSNINFKDYLKSFIIFICLILLTSSILNLLKNTLPLDIDKEAEFSYQHYLMMGLNEERLGVYSKDDVDYSRSFDTNSERNRATMQVVKSRIEEMGVTRISVLYAKKTLSNYNNGTFNWGCEGRDFFYIMQDDPNTPISKLCRGMYYGTRCDEVGEYYVEWANLEQCVWLTILTLSLLSVKFIKDSNKSIIALSIIGLTIFQTIFEARSRYLFTYSPFYILLAIYGISVIMSAIKKASKENTISSEAEN